jgi:simple sugar transport system substrate-binding protein
MDNSRVNRAVEAAHVAGAKVFSIGNDNRDACATAPNSCLGTSYWSWGTLYTELFDQIHRGTWDPSQPINEPITANVETSPIGFAVNTPVTGTDIAISANELLASLSKPGGKSLPFTGPLCSTGQRASCVSEGEAVADAELLTMCWFVDGVVEKVDPIDPKSADRPARVPDACLTQQ